MIFVYHARNDTRFYRDISRYLSAGPRTRARQYLDCPASSASVERLFSQVGIAFSAKRKSAEASTIADIIFAQANLP